MQNVILCDNMIARDIVEKGSGSGMSWRLIVLAVIYTIEPYIWLKSMSTLGWKNEKLKRYSWVFFLGYYILTLVKQYVAFTKGTGGEWTICFGILLNLYMILSFFWFKGSILKRIYTIGLFFICVYITEMIAFSLIVIVLKIPTAVFFELGFVNTICTLITKVLLIPVCYIIFLKEENMIRLLYRNKELFPLIVLTVIFEMVTFSIFGYQKFKEISLESIIIITLSQTILLATMFYITAILRKVKAELEQKKEIIRLTNSLDNLRHDMSSHVRMLKSYAKKGQYDELVDYMNKAFADIDVAENICTSDNYAVSVVISSFLSEAKNKKIKFTRSINVQNFMLSDSEICSLLSNILKNAMEAAENVSEEDRFICLEISPLRKGYYINCINSYQIIPKCENGQLQTTKQDKISHGRGINIIKSIVEKNNRGKVTTNFEESFFEINCEFYGKEG